MESYLDELNPIQRAAATHASGPALVIAGPGSGKTRVLTYRIAHQIHQGTKPWEILALTFTNKAAKEMKDRISKVVGDKANAVWAGTFHSIFARILRSESEHIGYPSNFTIYDTQDSHSAINEVVKQMGLDGKAYPAGAVMSKISLAKNQLITPAMYKMDSERLLKDKQDKRPELYKIYENYLKHCRRSGAMDFDDLLLRMHELLEKHEAVATKYRQKFKYLLVDEFQDTNALQSAIVKLLVNYPGSPRNLTVVGDDAQSIYAFRGATIQNILDFQKEYPDLTVYKLEQNYRSTQFIVKAANEVIAHNKRQLKKTIFTDKDIKESEPIKVIKTLGDEEEGRRVVDIINEQKNRYHLRNQDIAILYRTNAQSRIFEEALTNHRIAYKVFGGLSFYQRKEVKDFLAYLRVALNPADEEAIRRIINYPRRGIGDTTVDKLSAVAASMNLPLWSVLKDPSAVGLQARAANPLREFVFMMEELQKKVAGMTAYDFAVLAGRKSGILLELKSDTTPEGTQRFENVTALMDGIKAFTDDDTPTPNSDNPDDRSLAAYLQNIALISDLDSAEGDEDRVKLMSVHAAKGLEFKSVFIVGLEENVFPSFMALQSHDYNAIDEERRLFYVAITRAEKFLTLTYSQSRMKFGKIANNERSRFLDEISAENLETSINRARYTNTGPSGFKGAALPPSLKRFDHVGANKKTEGDFTPSPVEKIVVGAKVLHERFGEGQVMDMDGAANNRVATILFEHPDAGEKRIMLKFARLKVFE